MSLIQKALRKSTEERELSPPLPPVFKEPRRGGRSFSNKQIGLVIVLLFCLVGVLVYSLSPLLWSPGKTRTTVPQTPAVGPTPGTKLPGGKEFQTGPATTHPPNPASGPMTQSPLKEKPSAPSFGEIKVNPKDTSGGTLAPAERFPENQKVPEKEPGAGIFFTKPTPAPTKSLKQAREKRAIPKGGPANFTEGTKPQAEEDEKGAVEVIRLFNEAVRDQKKGLWDQAIQGYQEVLHLRPNHPEAYNNLGLIYQDQKKFPKALEMFQKALSLNPHYLKGVNNLGLFYLSQEKWEEAAGQFSRAIELDSSFVPAYINLSAVYKNMGRLDLARKTLYQALELDGNNLEAQYNLGLLWEKEGYPNKAFEHYQKFVSKAHGSYSGLADELRKKWPELK